MEHARSWTIQITVLSALMGGLVALSLKTQDRILKDQLPDVRQGRLARAFVELREDATSLRRQVLELQKRLREYQLQTGSDSEKSKLLAQDLILSNVLAGTVSVSGPGVAVTLRDSKLAEKKPDDISEADWRDLSEEYYIHDRDIRDVVNELRASGAEAISVNDQRVTGLTPIRCVGPVVMVNDVRTAGSPVVVRAIGDPDALLSGMMMTKGVLDAFRDVDPTMVSIDKVKSHTLPAYAGTTTLRYAKVANESKANEAQLKSEHAEKLGDKAVQDPQSVIRDGGQK